MSYTADVSDAIPCFDENIDLESRLLIELKIVYDSGDNTKNYGLWGKI